jgi:YHS domain-containing protein
MTLSTTRLLPIAATAVLVLSAAFPVLADEIYSTRGIAINGYDPVAYFTEQRPVKGSADFTSTYKGAVFHFASALHRDAFAKEPERYAPQYDGYCAYGTARGYKATTEPQAFTVVDNKLYLNYSDDIARTWKSDRGRYIKKADANWDTVRAQPAP